MAVLSCGCAEKCKKFLSNFSSAYDAAGGYKYAEMLVRAARASQPGSSVLTPAHAPGGAQQDVANRRRRTLDVELDDLASVRAAAGGERPAAAPF